MAGTVLAHVSEHLRRASGERLSVENHVLQILQRTQKILMLKYHAVVTSS